MAVPSSHSLKEYLKRYQSCNDDPKRAKKKKKKEENLKPKSTVCGVLVVDEDPVWQKPVEFDDAEEEDNSTGEEKPQVEEDIEVKRMKRLEALRSLKPYHSINEDGSGWVSIPKPSLGKDRDLSPQQNQRDSGNLDLSPFPSQRRRRFDSPLMEIDEKPSDSNTDLSPPCQLRRRLDSPSPEPQLNGYGGEASDLSPPRRAEDLSPPRRAKPRTQEVVAGRHLPEADLSPPRKKRKGPVDDLSPPRRYRESPEADSYPLSRTRKGPSNDFHPPPRARSSPATDLSPPRRTRKGSPDDLSPGIARKRSLRPTEVQITSLPDLSNSMRAQYGSSENLSLPRKSRHELAEGSRNSYLPSDSLSNVRIKEPSLTKEERRSGLLSAKEMKEEIDMKRKQDKLRFAAMNPLLTGRDAEAVHRDKEGKKISKEELSKSKQEKKEEKPLEWGKGLAQKRKAEERGKELELEMERPFARSRDDPELEMMLKGRIRWGDPMAHLVKPKNSELILEDLGENEKMKESGFIIPQTIPSHSWLKRGLDFHPNRYDIRPGRHWDGVDRSNGYEKELFKRQNEKRATETEAYLWSVSDM